MAALESPRVASACDRPRLRKIDKRQARTLAREPREALGKHRLAQSLSSSTPDSACCGCGARAPREGPKGRGFRNPRESPRVAMSFRVPPPLKRCLVTPPCRSFPRLSFSFACRVASRRIASLSPPRFVSVRFFVSLAFFHPSRVPICTRLALGGSSPFLFGTVTVKTPSAVSASISSSAAFRGSAYRFSNLPKCRSRTK